MADLTTNLGLQRLGVDDPNKLITPAMWNAVVDALDVAGVGVAPVIIPAATTAYTFLAANSGKLHVVEDLTGDATFTLPAVANGLRFRLVYGGAAADAQDWLVTTTDGYFVGNIVWLTHTTSDAVDPVYSDGNSNDNLDLDTPAGGTILEFWSDGTVWYVTGVAVTAATPAFAD